ncbi:MAG: hypothetical protein AAGC53_06150 [Actinomycetota bacterium]
MPRLVLLCLAIALIAAGCGEAVDAGGESIDDDEFIDEPTVAEDLADEVCDPDLVGDEDGPVESIYTIDDGALAGLCWGDPDETVTGAFELLELVAGPDQLRDVAYVGGFNGGADTLAFVVPVDDDYSSFVIAIDTVAAVDDPNELRLTLLHEFAHVLTQRNDELDLDGDPLACSTHWNGIGCFVPGSYVDSWVQAFWPEDELRTLPTDGVDQAAGEERCAIDPSFLGAYAASDPEEDFAESFSGFVFGLDVPDAVQPRLEFFAEYPELRAMRERAFDEGLAPQANTFDRCG